MFLLIFFAMFPLSSTALDFVAVPPWCGPLLLLPRPLTCAYLLLKTHF
jgi:hypothetical protein